MLSATTLVRLRRYAIHALLGCAGVALLLTSPSSGRHPSAFGPSATAGSDWVEIARATFDDADDGPGDGNSFPADVGKLTTIVPSGKSLKDIAPNTGIASNRLVLSDLGTYGQNEFGVELKSDRAAPSGAVASFDFTGRCDNNKWSASVSGVSDGATTECCHSGDVSDGATTELVSVDVDAGNVSVNGHVFKMHANRGTVFHVEIGVYADDDGDCFEVSITNGDTGDVESWSDLLADGFRPVHALDIVKHAGHAGEIDFDNLSIFAPAH